jgi:hypothetical protein
VALSISRAERLIAGLLVGIEIEPLPENTPSYPFRVNTRPCYAASILVTSGGFVWLWVISAWILPLFSIRSSLPNIFFVPSRFPLVLVHSRFLV